MKAPEDAPIRKEAPTKRAALAGVFVAGLALVIVGVFSFWERPAQLPTYDETAWSGEAVEIAGFAELETRGLWTACPVATDGGTSRIGLVLADTWTATMPRIGVGGSVARLHGGSAEPSKVDAYDHGATRLMGRVLDPASASDAALIDAWTGMCGAIRTVALVAPETVIETPAVMN